MKLKIDSIGRTIQVSALITPNSVTSHKRSNISKIIPVGYHPIKDGKIYILHRTHLIADQLLPQGISCNHQNIICGTYHLNIDLMSPIEKKIKKYVKDHNCNVFYSIIPLYTKDFMIPYKLKIIAFSLGLKNISPLRIYTTLTNNQPNYTLNYQTGECLKII